MATALAATKNRKYQKSTRPAGASPAASGATEFWQSAKGDRLPFA
jgi:hypothetical protein